MLNIKEKFGNYLLLVGLFLFSTFYAETSANVLLTPGNGTNCLFADGIEFRWEYQGAKTVSKFILEVKEIGLTPSTDRIVASEEYPANIFGHVMNLLPGREYTLTLTARFTDDTQETSESTFNTALPNVKPIATAPTNQCSVLKEYTLSWAYPADSIAVYQVEFSKTAAFAPIATINTSDTLILINDTTIISFGEKFYYRIRAKSLYSDCFTDWSNVNTGQVLSKPVAPVFSSENIPNGQECVYINPTIYLEEQATSSLKYFVDISETSDFETIIETFESRTDSIHCFLQKFDQIYYYRAYTIDTLTQCISDFSEVRTLKTRFEQPILVFPDDYAKGADAYKDASNHLIHLVWTNPNIKNSDSLEYDYNIQLSLTDEFLVDDIVGEFRVNALTSYDARLNTPAAYNDTIYWRVNTVKNGCASDWSTVRKFHSPYETPVPVWPNIGEQCFIKGDFRWEKSKDTDGYEIYLSTENTFTDTNKLKIYQLYGNTDSLFVEITNPETVYYWKIRAIDATNSSFWSNTLQFRTATAVPNLVSPEDNQQGVDLSTTFEWMSKDNSTYNFQLSEDEDFSNMIVDTLLDTNSFEIILEKNDGVYYWRVANIVGACQSDWSKTWTFVTKLPAPVITSPKDKSKLEFAAVVFNWEEVANAKLYELQYSMDSTFEESNYITKIPFNYYYDNYLVADTLYYWRVKSLNERTESDWSKTYSFRSGIYEPKKPLLVSPKNTVNKVETNTNFIWSKLSNVSSYVLQYSTTIDFLEDSTITVENIQDTVYTVEAPLKNFTLYYWRVSSINEDVQSEWSEIWTFRTIKAAPKTAPILLEPVNNTTGLQWDAIRLYWNAVEGASWYSVQVANKTAPDNYIINNSKVVDTSLAMMSNLDTNKTYQWKVRAGNEGGESPWSSIWEFSTSKNLSIYEISFITGITSSPNPTSGDFSIEFTIAQPVLADIIISDLSGKEISRISNYYETGNHIEKFELNNLYSGKYMCYILVNNKITAATQIIINK